MIAADVDPGAGPPVGRCDADRSVADCGDIDSCDGTKGRRRGLLGRVGDDERGAGYLAAFIVLFSMLTVVGVGILVDSSRYFTSFRQCGSVALEAARAGANAVDPSGVHEGVIVVDPSGAQSAAGGAAAAFVSGSGATLEWVQVDGDLVRVRVSADVDSWFPFMPDRTVTQEAAARATRVDG